MDYADRKLKDPYDIEQSAMIGRIHSMGWLKNNVQSGHKQRIPNTRQRKNDLHKTKLEEQGKDNKDISPSNIPSGSRIVVESVKSIAKIDVEHIDPIVRENIESALHVVGVALKNMETVWRKDVEKDNMSAPNSQSLILDKLEEQEMMCIALTENIVMAQLEQCRSTKEIEIESNSSCIETDNNIGHKVKANPPDPSKSESNQSSSVDLKDSCDDNNNSKRESQSVQDVMKNTPKTVSKTGVKKLGGQKISKSTGAISKDFSKIPKQLPKERDVSNVSSCSSNKSSESSPSLKKSLPMVPKGTDKDNNKQSLAANGAKLKEHEPTKQNTSTLNTSKDKPLGAISDDKRKSIIPRIKSPRVELIKKSNDTPETKKCHQVQIKRTQSFNPEYNKTRPLIKSHDKIPAESNSRNSSLKTSSSAATPNKSDKVHAINKVETTRKVAVSESNGAESCKGVSAKTSAENTAVSRYTTNTKSVTKSVSSTPIKPALRCTYFNSKINIRRNSSGDQVKTQECKRDSNIYRRSSILGDPAPSSTKLKADVNKKSAVTDNTEKHTKLNRTRSIDSKSSSPSESIKEPSSAAGTADDTKKTDDSETNIPKNNETDKPVDTSENSVDTDKEKVVDTVEKESNLKTEDEESTHPKSANSAEVKSVTFCPDVQEIHIPNFSAASANNPTSLEKPFCPFEDTPNPIHPSNIPPTEESKNMEFSNFPDNNRKFVEPISTHNSEENLASFIQSESVILPPPGFRNPRSSPPRDHVNLPFSDACYFTNPEELQMLNCRTPSPNDFNNAPPAGYMQHSLFYLPPFCLQGWNPMMQYPGPFLQNLQYPNCSPLPGQMMPDNSNETFNCPPPTSQHNDPYKQFHQIQPNNHSPEFISPIKQDNYLVNVQTSKNRPNNARMKETAFQTRHSRYNRTAVPKEYQNCSQQFHSANSSYSHLDSASMSNQYNVPTQIHQQHNNYRNVNSSNYQRLPENFALPQNDQDYNGRCENSSENDPEFVPPMVSPKACMYKEFSYPKKTDNMSNSRYEVRNGAHRHYGSSSQRNYVPSHQRYKSYQTSAQDSIAKTTVGRGICKTIHQ